MRKVWIKERIEEAVKCSQNIRQCLIYLGIDPRSSSRNTLKKKIVQYNIDCSHFKVKHYNRTFNGQTQICSCCGKEKPITEFYVKSKNKSGVQSVCKECTSIKYNKTRRQRLSNLKLTLLQQLGGQCSCCHLPATSENFVVFDFHHIDSKDKKFSISTSKHISPEELKEELSKCTILCANCHRLYHYKNKKV